MTEEELNGKSHDYFKAVVRDAIEELKKEGYAYLFTYNQIEEVKKRFPNAIIKEEEGIFYIRLPKNASNN